MTCEGHARAPMTMMRCHNDSGPDVSGQRTRVRQGDREGREVVRSVPVVAWSRRVRLRAVKGASCSLLPRVVWFVWPLLV